ncbi:MAG: hypothetical protein P8J87_09130, partial [Verrucomicrobiales bacterium]|nr:hypothetical protein [Verrucomicrobiales bacterium]
MAAGDWQHVEVPIPPGTPDFNGIIFKKWFPTDDTGLAGLASISIDNIQLLAAGGGGNPFGGEVEPLNNFDDGLSSAGFWRWW